MYTYSMWIKGVFLTMLGFGIFVLMQVLLPVAAYQVWEWTTYNDNRLLVDPTDESRVDKLVSTKVRDVLVKNINNFSAFVVNAKEPKLVLPYKEFKVSVPSINQHGLKTAVYSDDFENQLAHLKGSALPGEKGNVFITGHSSLATVFGGNKGPFVELPKVKKGDEIYVEALGQKFTYVVIGVRVVDPKDTSVVIPPDEDGRYLTLMTCVPPGLTTKRLIVLAKIKGI